MVAGEPSRGRGSARALPDDLRVGVDTVNAIWSFGSGRGGSVDRPVRRGRSAGRNRRSRAGGVEGHKTLQKARLIEFRIPSVSEPALASMKSEPFIASHCAALEEAPWSYGGA